MIWKLSFSASFAAAILGTCFSLVADADEPAPHLLRIDSPELPALNIPVAGIWRSEYDRTLDGSLKPRESPLLEILTHNDRLTGRYQNLRAVGKDNDSVFAGSIVRGRNPMVTLRQDHSSGYTAIYTGKLVSANRFVGTYMDNTGASGDWSLELQAESDTALPSVDRSEGSPLIRGVLSDECACRGQLSSST